MTTLDLSANAFASPIIDGINQALSRLPLFLLWLAIGIIIVRSLVYLGHLLLGFTQIQAGLRQVVASIIQIILWLILAFQLLKILGLGDIIYFFTGSVAAIGLAMAAGGSTLISDVIAGIFLARDDDFSVGDEVVVGETPTQGVIERMDARRTRLRDKDGILHVIPNSTIERKEWVLVSKGPEVNKLAKAIKTAKKLKTAIRKNGY